MADKRYYWLKLKEDFFQDEAINWLEEQENGKEYVLFYLKLCLKSLKNDGILIRQIGTMLVPYDEKKLSEITNTDFDTVVIALGLLQQIGLVERFEDGKILLTQLENMVGSENTSAERKRKSRANQIKCDNVTLMSQISHENVTTEYRDKSIEIRERDKSKRESIDYQRIVDMYNDTCVSFPRLKTLSENRKKSIKARFNSGYTYENFQELFKKAENSSFLKGANNRNWSATFDWLIKDSNMAKVLDGNYDNINSIGKNYNGGTPVWTEEDYNYVPPSLRRDFD